MHCWNRAPTSISSQQRPKRAQPNAQRMEKTWRIHNQPAKIEIQPKDRWGSSSPSSLAPPSDLCLFKVALPPYIWASSLSLFLLFLTHHHGRWEAMLECALSPSPSFSRSIPVRQAISSIRHRYYCCPSWPGLLSSIHSFYSPPAFYRDCVVSGWSHQMNENQNSHEHLSLLIFVTVLHATIDIRNWRFKFN